MRINTLYKPDFLQQTQGLLSDNEKSFSQKMGNKHNIYDTHYSETNIYCQGMIMLNLKAIKQSWFCQNKRVAMCQCDLNGTSVNVGMEA